MEPALDSTPTDLESLREEAAALTELEHRKKAFPLFFYIPAPKVRPFHESDAPLRILGGGNRSGKSESGTAESCAYALGYRPWVLRELGIPMPDPPWIRPDDLPDAAICFSGAGVRVKIPNEVFIVTGQNAKQGIAETLWPKIKKLIGPFITTMHMSHAGTPADCTLKNGSRLVFGSDEQKSQVFESTNYSFYQIDELVKQNTYRGIKRGSIDQFAPIIMTFTPVGAKAGWIFRDLYTPGLRVDQDKIHVTTISIYDNPYLDQAAIAEFAADPSMTDIEKEARLYGRFRNLIDRIYPDFNDEIHVIPPFTPPAHWFQGMVVDPHTVRPWFVAYFCVTPRGHVIFFKEWPPTDWTRIRRDPRSYDDYIALLHQLEGDRPPDCRLIDPNFGPRRDVDRTTGMIQPSIISHFGRYGIHFFHKLEDDLKYGEGKVRTLLYYDQKQPVNQTNCPKLYFTEDCPNLIAGMSFYTAKVIPAQDNAVDEDKREETYKDPCDCVRYVAVSDLGQSVLNESYHQDLFETQSTRPSFEGYGEEK